MAIGKRTLPSAAIPIGTSIPIGEAAPYDLRNRINGIVAAIGDVSIGPMAVAATLCAGHCATVHVLGVSTHWERTGSCLTAQTMWRRTGLIIYTTVTMSA